MINRLIEASLNNRFVVLLLVVALIGLGTVSMLRLPVDAVPDITSIQVQVLTNAPALGPVEVEQFITFPVEAAMSGLPRVTEIRSVTRFGLSAVTVVFEEGTDIYWARQLVNERLQQARENIPEGFGSPEMGPISTGLGEILQFEVRAKPGYDYSLMDLRSILDWDIAFKLRSVPGVVEVNTFGGQLKTYEVQIDPDKLLNYNISLSEVFEALQRNNTNRGGGYIVHRDEQRIVRGEGLIHNLDDVANIVLDQREDGTPIYVRDIGDVRFAPMIRQGAVTRDGRGEAVVGIVMMLIGENGRIVVDRVKEKIRQIEPSLPEGVYIDTFYDRNDLIRRTIKTVAENISGGALLVIVMLFLLVGNFRAGLLVAASIPLSALFMFIAMKLAGVSANLMSLGAIDFGIIVDSSVVMIENIIRRGSLFFREHRDQHRLRADVFRQAAQEVARPILFAGAIVIIVFIPILSLHGIEGKMFRPMAFSFMSALTGALILGVTVMPVMASLFLVRRISEQEAFLVRWCKKGYAPLVRWVMDRPVRTLSAAGIAFVASVGIAATLGAVFIPELDEGAIALQAWRLPSVSLQQSIESTTLIERILKHFPEVDTVVSKIGRAEIATDPAGLEHGDIYVMLTPHESLSLVEWPLALVGLIDWPKDHWSTIRGPDQLYKVLCQVHQDLSGEKNLSEQKKRELREWANEIFQEIEEHGLEFDKEKLVSIVNAVLTRYVPSNTFSFSQPIELRFQELIAGVRADIGISLYGPDLDVLKQKGDEIAAAVRQIRGAADVRAQLIAGLPNLQIKVNRQAIARYGINAADVLDAVGVIGGHVVGQVVEGQPRFPLQVRLNPAWRADPGALAHIKIADPLGRQIPLDQLAEISETQGPAMITRDAIQRRLLIEANVRGRDLAGFVAEAQQAVARQVELPPGYHVTWGGQFKNLQEAVGRLAIAVPVALFLIFALLFLTFNSGRLALLIYLNVPIAATGGILALWLRDMPFSISAGIGFIAVFGIAVMNGVVLVEHIRHLRKSGLNVQGAVFQGAMDRLRPVLMTATTDALGFLPMAVSTSAGAEVQRPLATVVIGGVITSCLLTLLVLPAIYRWFEPEVAEVEV
ncbi:MAG: efflux RND transporter permease subunit [Planctomycetes bacterium]|nr:efflux RND transporter permease subunit [Planctomycetota bacterium]